MENLLNQLVWFTIFYPACLHYCKLLVFSLDLFAELPNLFQLK